VRQVQPGTNANFQDLTVDIGELLSAVLLPEWPVHQTVIETRENVF
jgi:hypothetical protein